MNNSHKVPRRKAFKHIKNCPEIASYQVMGGILYASRHDKLQLFLNPEDRDEFDKHTHLRFVGTPCTTDEELEKFMAGLRGEPSDPLDETAALELWQEARLPENEEVTEDELDFLWARPADEIDEEFEESKESQEKQGEGVDWTYADDQPEDQDDALQEAHSEDLPPASSEEPVEDPSGE